MSNKIDTGGPAFPTRNEAQIGPISYHYEGMTLRDYFAAKAMQGILSNASLLEVVDQKFEADSTRDAVSKYAFGVADAMIKERNNYNGEPETPAV